MAKAEWNPRELYPCVGFNLTNLLRLAERIVASATSAAPANNGSKRAKARSNGRGCHAVLSPHKAAEPWSLTSLRERLIKIGTKVVSHGRNVTFQLADVSVSRQMFQES